MSRRIGQFFLMKKLLSEVRRGRSAARFGTTKPRRPRSRRRNRGARLKLTPQIGSLPGIGLPDTLNMKFKFTQAFSLTATTNDVATITLGLNNIFDPLGGASAIQPRYFDQIMAPTLYDSFLITYVTYKLTIINHSANTAMFQIALRDSDYVAPVNNGNMEGDTEFRNTTTVYIPPSGSGKDEKIIVGSVKPAAVLGLSTAQYNNDVVHRGSSTVGPVKNAFMFMHAAALATKNNAVDVTVLVEATFHARLQDLASDVARS